MKYHTTVPTSSISESGVEIHKTFLDTIGRTALVIKARNLVDDFRDRDLIVTYDYPFLASIRKPLVIFGSVFSIVVGAWVIGNFNLKFATPKA